LGYRRGGVQGRDNCADLFVFPPPPSPAREGGKGGGVTRASWRVRGPWK
jgi:hypothetical protein